MGVKIAEAIRDLTARYAASAPAAADPMMMKPVGFTAHLASCIFPDRWIMQAKVAMRGLVAREEGRFEIRMIFGAHLRRFDLVGHGGSPSPEFVSAGQTEKGPHQPDASGAG